MAAPSAQAASPPQTALFRNAALARWSFSFSTRCIIVVLISQEITLDWPFLPTSSAANQDCVICNSQGFGYGVFTRHRSADGRLGPLPVLSVPWTGVNGTMVNGIVHSPSADKETLVPENREGAAAGDAKARALG